MPENDAPQVDAGLGTEQDTGIKVNTSTEDAVAAAESQVVRAKVDSSTDGDQKPSFRKYIPDEYKDKSYWKNIPDEATLVKNYANAQELIGKKGVILPTEKDPPEKWEEFYKALGRPDTPDGYGIEKPADLPKEFPYDENRVKEFQELAHKYGLTPAAVKALYEWELQAGIKGFNAYNEQFTEVPGLGIVPKQWIDDHNRTVEAFKTELGDKYDSMMKKAAIAVMKYGGQDLKDFVDKTGFGDNPAMIRAWIKVAEATLTEDDLVGSKTGGMSRKERIAAINNDPALLDTSNLQKQRALVEERNRLIDEEYAESKA